MLGVSSSATAGNAGVEPVSCIRFWTLSAEQSKRTANTYPSALFDDSIENDGVCYTNDEKKRSANRRSWRFGSAMGLCLGSRKIVHTDDTSHATHSIQFVKNISANGDGNILKHTVSCVPGAHNRDVNIPQ